MPDDPAELRIRRATPADAETLFGFVSQLARYEKLAHEVVGSAGEMREQLASDRPPFEALLAELDTGPLGFALYFETYSTFHTARCLHLEDLFVTPEARGRGVGYLSAEDLISLSVSGPIRRLNADSRCKA